MDYRYIVKCSGCSWRELSTGISRDLAHLKEISNNCPTCGKPRRFRCPNCGQIAKMLKLKK